ncbi:hypothetical protein PILCRDRAFT_69007 [Piloderma croceum F 1598]|uniref:DUF1742-domain-containing protein n=1 Tax=Piloderma croceum (strain F 1598) TaxID=765440 RepID=A0A0C3FHG4_PILCF|nr:hypothetical protein PILCRDRAFT_69007 [Piloderma croceum F 1598]
MSFTNLYYRRATGTPKACYVCYKPTTTVLATINATDFIYTCDMHLTDTGFANSVEGSDGAGAAQKPGLSAEEIAKVKQDWEDLQRRKKEKEETKKKEKDDKEKRENEKAEGKEDKETVKQTSKVPGAWTPPSSKSPPPTPTHQRFTLHRDIFALRLSDHRKRRQTAQAKLLAPRLPGAPQGGFT